MKIERYSPEELPVSMRTPLPPRLPAKAEAPGRPPEMDRADISTAGRSISYLVLQVLAHPEIRGELVRELQAKIASGAYTVSSDQVAEAILKEQK
ncbi:MAG: flagellar biosynthesis anti-sigma factor FlgM [Clostridia bacterium]|nr:MAG: flagellar biosynthesis anti-sigma factor FlgM [Clostridia bacterium]